MTVRMVLPPELASQTARLCQRFIEAGGDTATAARCAPAFTKSLFLAESAIADPSGFSALIDPNAIGYARDVTAYRALVDALLATASDSAQAKIALRRLRRREAARIAWRDLELGCDVDIIMRELSAFADAVIGGALAWLQSQFTPRFGVPLDDAGQAMALLVLGMGKLGGGELNFSSDVDLLFIYEQDGVTRGGRRELEHQDYFDRLGRELIALLHEATADGYVFRVDMRLRPFGDSGPLTSSLAALEHYYAVHGRDWERYALIKARVVCGDDRCRLALDAIVRPFVYRRYLDYGALDALREMKGAIDREASSARLRDDIKRGRGGIREIEFAAQLFQLTRGGREPRLRERGLVPTLTNLAALGLLAQDEAAMLIAAYRDLRTLEHRLQQVRDEQTHRLPESALERARIAYGLQHADWASCAAATAVTRARVHTLFAALLGSDTAQTTASVWRELWHNAADVEDTARRLAARGRATPVVFAEQLAGLKAERFQSHLSAAGRARLDRIMPTLIDLIVSRAIADAVAQRLGELLRAIAGRSVYLAFLADHPDALARVVELFAASPWIAQQITRHPLLLDELLDPRVLYAPPDQARLHALIVEQIGDDEELERAMDALRTFKNQQVLRVAASDVTQQFPIAEVSNQLTYIAEACLARALALAWRDLTRRFGAPRVAGDEAERAAGFAVIGYGKLGGWELGYGSDLDLVFVHDCRDEGALTTGERALEHGVFFGRLAQRLIHILTTTTAAGTAYDVDTRLRPSGGAGQLVANIDAFADYQAREAWVWEHQALVRARAVAGDPALRARFGEVRAAILSRERDPLELARAVVEMRRRMQDELDRSQGALFDLKHGRGGITDVEFMVQYAVLRWAASHPRLLTWTDNLRLLEIIAELGLLPAADCRSLHDAYFAYRAEVHRRALQQEPSIVDGARFSATRDAVRLIWDRVFA